MSIDPRDHEPPSPRPTPGGFTTWFLGIAIGVAIALVITVTWMLGKEEGKNEAAAAASTSQTTQTAPTTTEPAEPPSAAAQLFASSCGGCHMLADAGTSGAVGPDLDALKPDAARVLAAIENGGTGVGAMPANIITGADAQEVADYVAEAAGG